MLREITVCNFSSAFGIKEGKRRWEKASWGLDSGRVTKILCFLEGGQVHLKGVLT